MRIYHRKSWWFSMGLHSAIWQRFFQLIALLITIFQKLLQFCQFNILFMIATQRQLSKEQKDKVPYTYEQEFYENTFCCFFTLKKMVLIKDRTLYIYDGFEDYGQRPRIFFNLNYTTFTLYEDSLRISNRFSEITLRHPKATKLLDLMEAANRSRTTVFIEDIYKRKFIYFESPEEKELKKY